MAFLGEKRNAGNVVVGNLIIRGPFKDIGIIIKK
jgi:hypothetical protein